MTVKHVTKDFYSKSCHRLSKERTHTGEVSFECIDCGKRFSQICSSYIVAWTYIKDFTQAGKKSQNLINIPNQ